MGFGGEWLARHQDAVKARIEARRPAPRVDETPLIMVSSRAPHEVPSCPNAARLVSTCVENGWRVVAQHAVALMPATHYLNGKVNTPATLRETFAVRYQRGREVGAALWVRDDQIGRTDGKGWSFEWAKLVENGEMREYAWTEPTKPGKGETFAQFAVRKARATRAIRSRLADSP